ncbi:hypothetical protein MKZ26_08040 [Sporosarcina sp. FSL K6-6792]|uniref:hypothetical protein n=1 Tax=Sporosarcina sp. FSL K6-6792 TaxID=2921559 RepID=UPI0030FA1CB0
MTYAELYGDIKKRPLKCGLGNKMIGENRIKSVVADELLGFNKLAEVGGTMSEFKNLVSPVTQLNDSVLSSFENQMTKFDNLAGGIHNALAISNYRRCTG